MKSIERKLRKNEFLPHPELNMHDWAGLWGLVAKLHVPFYLILLFFQDYFSLLATMDAVIVALMVLFIFTLKPLMMRGVIEGYYRMNYEGTKSMIWSFIFIGATIRTVLLGLYYAFIFSWVAGDETNHRHMLYMKGFEENFSSIVGLVLGLALCGYLFYSLFYKHRFISIREFSNKVAMNMKRGLNYKDSSYRVLNEKGYQLEQNPVQHVKYQNSGTGDLFRNNNTETNRNSSVSEKAKSVFSPMRRQARK